MIEILDVEEEGFYYDISLLPPKQRSSLQLGDSVQLMIHDGKPGEIGRGERLWFTVVGVKSGFYCGQLIESPQHLEYTQRGAWLKFEPHHVIEIKRLD